jgi:hypothetical protein
MMITYHPHMKKNHNLKMMVLEMFIISKYNFKMSKLQDSFAKCKWVIMCMENTCNFEPSPCVCPPPLSSSPTKPCHKSCSPYLLSCPQVIPNLPIPHQH